LPGKLGKELAFSKSAHVLEGWTVLDFSAASQTLILPRFQQSGLAGWPIGSLWLRKRFKI
jgi:hypothetical protein